LILFAVSAITGRQIAAVKDEGGQLFRRAPTKVGAEVLEALVSSGFAARCAGRR